MSARRLLGLLGLLVALPVAAELPLRSPAEVVDRFHQALRASDAQTVIGQLAPDLVVFETGYAETSAASYLRQTLPNDMAFAAVTTRRLMDRREERAGDTAWIMSVVEIRGEPGGEPLRLRQTETMLLRRYADGWKIAHIHWSAHPLQEE